MLIELCAEIFQNRFLEVRLIGNYFPIARIALWFFVAPLRLGPSSVPAPKHKRRLKCVAQQMAARRPASRPADALT